jgi:hypothetical protein
VNKSAEDSAWRVAEALSQEDLKFPGRIGWRQGIGNDSRKVWDERDRLVATFENAKDAMLVVELHNSMPTILEALWKADGVRRP